MIDFSLKLYACIMLLLLFLFLPSCNSYSTEKSQVIDVDFVSKVLALETASTMTLTSPGGWPEGIIAGEYIYLNDINILVKRFCISSCVEYILAAANDVTLEDFPIIAVHGNPEIWRQQSRLLNGVDDSSCEGEVYRQYMEFKDLVKISNSFSPTQIEKLNILSIEQTLLDNGCFKPAAKYSHDYWLLSNDELNNYFQGTFKGGTCVDDAKKCFEKLNSSFPIGTSFTGTGFSHKVK